MNLVKTTRLLAFALATGSTLFAVSCGDLIISSVKNGLLSFVTGSVATTLNTAQLNSLTNASNNTATTPVARTTDGPSVFPFTPTRN